MGWSSNSTGVYSSSGIGKYWVLWRGNDELRTFANGASATGANPTGTKAAGETVGGRPSLDIRIVLDWTLATPKVFYSYKNPSASEWTSLFEQNISESNVDGITRVGISANSTSAGWYSFEIGLPPAPPAGTVIMLW